LERAIEKETRFGIGANFKNPRDHAVMEADWNVTPVTHRLKDKAWSQLGTSGSGNHFVEFGVFAVDNEQLAIPPGQYLALLSHSGSRGAGATIAGHYSKLAMRHHPELPDALSHLAWLDLAEANHACIHQHMSKALGATVLLDLENHHNYAWEEEHDGETLIVHRKGATPAGEGVIGIIPGSMASPTYIVRGKGSAASMNSAAHGAGRVMSRTRAKQTFAWSQVRKELEERGVKLISAGLDEVPGVYKDIDAVMAAQEDLVERIAMFQPRLVKMAPPGERPED
jgi:tRNA-splicing ligase RtcB